MRAKKPQSGLFLQWYLCIKIHFQMRDIRSFWINNMLLERQFRTEKNTPRTDILNSKIRPERNPETCTLVHGVVPYLP